MSEFHDVKAAFLLGLRMAEELHGLRQNSTLEKDEFTVLIWAIARGDETLLESSAEMDLPPGAQPAEVERRYLSEEMKKVARSLVNWMKSNL